MNQLCRSCKAELESNQGASSPHAITQGLCHTCVLSLGASQNREVLDAIDAPVLLMQPNPRQVVTANTKTLELFDKELSQIEEHRGGQVFDCIYSFTEAGCGKDPNCQDCKIKNAIVDTFTTGSSFDGISTYLKVKKNDGTATYTLQISTEKVGDWALVKIDRYEKV